MTEQGGNEKIAIVERVRKKLNWHESEEGPGNGVITAPGHFYISLFSLAFCRICSGDIERILVKSPMAPGLKWAAVP